MREFLNQHRVTAGLLIGLIIVGSLYWLWSRSGPVTPTTKVANTWFYDIDSEQLYPAETTLVPPVEAPSGGVGVAAYVYACGDCSNTEDRWIVYLAKWPDEIKAEADALLADDADPRALFRFFADRGEEQLVSRTSPRDWYPRDSQMGQAIVAIKNCADGNPPVLCRPQ